jgi:uncharacterized protein YdgA (DUF945 family)
VKKVVAVVAAVAAVGVAYAGGAYVLGQQVEARLKAQTDLVAGQLPFLSVSEQQHDRGLFSSTRTTTYRLGCSPTGAPAGAPEPLSFTVRDHILHGPLPGGRAVGLALIESELVPSAEAAEELARLFGAERPLRVRTVVGLGGGFTTELSSPALRTQLPKGEQLNWQGLRGTVQGDASGKDVTYELSVPGLELLDPAAGVHVVLSDAHVRGQARPLNGSLLLAVGTSEGRLASFEVSGPATGGAQQGTPPWNLTLRDLRFASDAAVADDLLGMKATVTGSGSFGETRLDKVELDWSLRRVHAPSYQKIVSAFMGASCGARRQDPQAAFAGVQAELAELLVHDPEYALDRVALELDGKRGELSYSVGVEGVTAEDAALPAPVLLTTKGSLKADAKLPVEWVLRLGAFAAAQSRQPVPSPEVLNEQVDRLVAQGLVVRDGDLLESSVRFAHGALTVNGQPMPLPGAR